MEVLANDEFSGEHTMGITKFSDLTKEEFKAQYLTLKTPNGLCLPSTKFLKSVETIPSELDWRTKGGVSPIKNQLQCGSTWAFSAVAYLESQSLIKNKKAVTYSEQQIVDCDQADYGCSGGLMQTALQYIQVNGIESDVLYPYKGYAQTCQYDKTKVIASASDIHCYENLSNSQIQSYLNTVGPLSVAVDATTFSFYTSGILDCKGKALNHAILVVGYTSDIWILKEAWGKDFGEEGFLRVQNKPDHNCAIGEYIVTASLN